MKKLFFVLILLAVLAGLFNYRAELKNYWLELIKPELPEAVKYQPVEKAAEPEAVKYQPVEKAAEPEAQEANEAEKSILPESYNLNAPFTSQAPLGDWQMPFKEACEEVSALIVHYYYQNKEFTPELATEEIVKMVDWQKNYFGGHFDLTAGQMKEMIEKYLGYTKVEIIDNPTIEEIKKHLLEKRPVIIPVAGRQLNNPYFQTPGPIYHMLVIKGYTENGFITNDPGTKRGEDFLYDYDIIMKALHDLNEEDMDQGEPRIIVIYP